MSRNNQSIRIVGLFLLLFDLVIVPAVLLEYQNESCFDQITTYQVKDLALGNGGENELLNAWERIQIINYAVAEVQTVGYSELKSTEPLFEEMKQQLRLLQEYNVLPAFSFSEKAQTVYEQRTYIASEKPEQAVKVWVICSKLSDMTVYAYMDSEISVIYDLMILADYDMTVPHGETDRKKCFYKYLNSFGTECSLTPDDLSFRCMTGKGETQIDLCSVNMGTKEYAKGWIMVSTA